MNLNRRYIEKLERVVIWCSKEEKEEIKRAAEGAEVSMNEYLKGAAKERIARDTQGANG